MAQADFYLYYVYYLYCVYNLILFIVLHYCMHCLHYFNVVYSRETQYIEVICCNLELNFTVVDTRPQH